MPRVTLTLAAALYVLTATTAAAQGILDRKVGPDQFGRPLEFAAFTEHDIGALSAAADVPIGFERVGPYAGPRKEPVLLTGLSVRDAAAAMVALDPRYDFRDEDGVLMFAPAGRLDDPLDARAPAVDLGEVIARDAFGLAAALLGAPSSTAIAFDDTKPFVLEAPEGTIRSLLNAIVRAHGQLVWTFGPSAGRDRIFPYDLSFLTGVHGMGIGLSGRGPWNAVDVTRFRRSADRPANVLDTIVGNETNGYPLIMSGMSSYAVWRLATTTGVPMGIEVATGRVPRRPENASVEFRATGRTLREVLDRLLEWDNRYEWRELDGVVVVRPVSAWSDSANVLFSLVADVEQHEVTTTEAVKAVVKALGGGDQKYSVFPDSRRVSVSAGRGSAMDLLNALVKVHGSLAWSLEPAEGDEIRATGLGHRLTLRVAGGTGLGVLVR